MDSLAKACAGVFKKLLADKELYYHFLFVKNNWHLFYRLNTK